MTPDPTWRPPLLFRPAPAGMTFPSRPKVVLLLDSTEPSGVGEHVLTLARRLQGDADVTIANVDLDRTGWAERAATVVPTVQLGGPGDTCCRFVRFLDEVAPDILHIHAGIGWEALDVPAVARACGVPVVLRTEHLPNVMTEPFHRATYAQMGALLDAVVCVSAATRDSYRGAGVPRGRLRVIRNGVEPRPQARDRAATRHDLAVGAAPVLLTVARFSEQKGYPDLIDTAEIVLGQRPDARFLWVGDGPTRPACGEILAARGLDASVTLLGARSDVGDLMAAADLLVSASRFEGHPLVVLEAMAAGLPVVATRVPGTAEAVEHGVTGRLAPAADLGAAILAALDAPAETAAYARAAQARARRTFSAARMTARALALYRSLLAEAVHRHAVAPNEAIAP
ncbi:glycosyltransferase [Prosthecomicrobium sp. N25]|uniref:glycosyltransferase n=1 Tax=Prosthecomicrobium sp. N25 TaxID=3129254 RepID=UPI003076BD79